MSGATLLLLLSGGPPVVRKMARVPRDPKGRKRERDHQQVVQVILNALLRRGDISQVGLDDFIIGYTPGDATDWAGTAPTTMTEALDRIAVLLKTLNGGTGP